MFADGWRSALGALSAPGAGLIFALGWVGSALVASLAARRLDVRARPAALRIRYWSGWPFLGRLVAAGLAIAWLFALLGAGVFVTSDAGLGHVAARAVWADRQLVEQWLALTGAGGALMLLLWLPHWLQGHLERNDTEAGLSPLSFVVAALGHQAALAILRSAAIPIVGVYWGGWVAPCVKLIVMLALPQVRRRLKRGRRSLVYLEWALDWQSAALFALLGNLWLTTLSRLMVGALLRLAHRVAVRRRATTRRPEPSSEGASRTP